MSEILYLILCNMQFRKPDAIHQAVFDLTIASPWSGDGVIN